ncbi:hypothetical protein CP061683_0891A, partial [Chlamydia psittaci 06-1683]
MQENSGLTNLKSNSSL